MQPTVEGEPVYSQGDGVQVEAFKWVVLVAFGAGLLGCGFCWFKSKSRLEVLDEQTRAAHIAAIENAAATVRTASSKGRSVRFGNPNKSPTERSKLISGLASDQL